MSYGGRGMGSMRRGQRSFANMFGQSSVSFDTVFNTIELNKQIRTHLSQVYLTLMATMLACAAGVYAQIVTGFNMPVITLLLSIGIIIYLAFDSRKTEFARRSCILLLFGFLHGLSLGPLIDLAMDIDVSIVLISVLATATIFVSFSLFAVMAERRSMLFLGGIISSFFSMMFWMAFVNIFIGSSVVYDLRLYGGLFIFCLYVIYDTQMIIEKRYLGDTDIVGHALELFVDFVAILVRILIILIRNSEKKKDERKR